MVCALLAIEAWIFILKEIIIMLKTLIFGLVICFANSVQATLISDLSERDWGTVGDGLVTYDRSTGLEWLDLTVTSGNSLIDTESDSSIFGEFRWATESEIEGVMDAALLGILNRKSTDIGVRQAASTFISLFGATNVQSDFTSTHGATRLAPYYNQGEIQYGTANVLVHADNFSIGWIPRLNCCAADSRRNTGIGSWLVRDAATNIPEPSTLMLFTIGLFSLLRRKSSI